MDVAKILQFEKNLTIRLLLFLKIINIIKKIYLKIIINEVVGILSSFAVLMNVFGFVVSSY